MSRFSRPDKVFGVFQPFMSTISYSGYTNNNFWASQGVAGLHDDGSLTFRFWRENGKVYQEGDIRVLIFPQTHICLGRFPEGFRPKQSVYIGKGCGAHTADIQLRVDPSGYMNMWASPKNPQWYNLDNNDGDCTQLSHPQVNGWIGYLNGARWQDGVERTSTYKYVSNNTELEPTVSDGTTTSPLDVVGFRCNSCWDVEY